MHRRTFLRHMAATGLALPGLMNGTVSALAFSDGRLGHITTPDPDCDRILVILRMFGGNDGLNTIIPVYDDEYYRVRHRTSRYDLSIPAEAALPIPGNNDHRFHPALGPMLDLYLEGKVAIVQGVGYPDMNLSHFRGNDIWLSASDADVFDDSGFIGRFLERRYPDFPATLPDTPYAIEFGSVVGRLAEGRHHTMAFPYNDRTRIPRDTGIRIGDGTQADRLEATIEKFLRQGSSFHGTIDRALQNVPGNLVDTYYRGDGYLGRALALTARLIRSGLGTQVYIIHAGQFDTHHDQQRVHAQQLDELFTNVLAFQREMEASGQDQRVCIMPISEFGRRVEPTGSGTDHGTAAPTFLIGGGVRGGLYGTAPSVRDLDADGNLKWNVDFRQIYASILAQWFCVPSTEVESHILPRYFQQLPLFRHAFTEPIPIKVQRDTPAPELQLHPNPALETLRIRIGGLPESADADVRISALDGRLISSGPAVLANGTCTWDVSRIPQGAYVVLVNTRGTTLAGRLIIRR